MNQRPGQAAEFGGETGFLGKPGLKWQLAPNPLAALDLWYSLPSVTVKGDALPSLCPAPSPTAQSTQLPTWPRCACFLTWLFEYVHYVLLFFFFGPLF